MIFEKLLNTIPYNELENGEASIASLQTKYWEKRHHPFVAGFELTKQCNLRCVHCYLEGANRNKKGLSTLKVMQIIDILYKNGVLILYFTGGEILTHPDFLEIYKYAKRKGFLIELLTNATLLNDSHIEVFNDLPPATISVSMYGANSETYQIITGRAEAYSEFCVAIKKLIGNDINVEIKYIGLKENIGDYEKAKEFAEKNGIKFSYNLEMFPSLFGDNETSSHALSCDEIINFEKKHIEISSIWNENIRSDNPYFEIPPDSYRMFSCNIASTLCFIDCEGYVHPCNKIIKQEHNLTEVDLFDAWSDYSKYREMLAPPDYTCAKCDNIFICSPCPAINMLSNGAYYLPQEQACELAKMRCREFRKDCYKNKL